MKQRGTYREHSFLSQGQKLAFISLQRIFYVLLGNLQTLNQIFYLKLYENTLLHVYKYFGSKCIRPYTGGKGRGERESFSSRHTCYYQREASCNAFHLTAKYLGVMQMLSKRSRTNCLTIDRRLIPRSSPRAIKRANLIHELGLGINRPDHFLRGARSERQ